MTTPAQDRALLGAGQPAAATPGAGSFASDLGALFWDPAQAFRHTAEAPRVLAPLLVFIGQQLVFTAIWLHKLDLQEFLRLEALAAGESAPDPGSVPEGLYRGLFWLSAVAIAPGLLVVIAAICMAALNVLGGLRITLRQSLSVVLHAFVAPYFVYLPLILLVMALRGDWNVEPQLVLQSSVAALLDRNSTAKALYAVAESLDLFSFWSLGLLAVGYRAVARRSAVGTLVGLWALWVLLRAAYTALLG